MATKRKADVPVPAEESDQLLIRPLWVQFIQTLLIVVIFRAKCFGDCLTYSFQLINIIPNRIKVRLIRTCVNSFSEYCNYCSFLLWLNRGAGQEVGRSCIILEFKGRKIMVSTALRSVLLLMDLTDVFWHAMSLQLDCGIHPGLEGMDALPYIDLIDPAEIDLLLISQWVPFFERNISSQWHSNICWPSVFLCQFSLGSLWSLAMVFTEDKF